MRPRRCRIRTLMLVVASAGVGFTAAPRTRAVGWIKDGVCPPVAIIVLRASVDVLASGTAIGIVTFGVVAGISTLYSAPLGDWNSTRTVQRP